VRRLAEDQDDRALDARVGDDACLPIFREPGPADGKRFALDDDLAAVRITPGEVLDFPAPEPEKDPRHHHAIALRGAAQGRSTLPQDLGRLERGVDLGHREGARQTRGLPGQFSEGPGRVIVAPAEALTEVEQLPEGVHL
jgi:hypothetical protein